MDPDLGVKIYENLDPKHWMKEHVVTKGILEM
jgi:hypothetical protein